MSRNPISEALARKKNRTVVHENVRKMTTALNCMHDDQPYYKRAPTKLSLASAKPEEVQTVQEKVVDYLLDRGRKMWP